MGEQLPAPKKPAYSNQKGKEVNVGTTNKGFNPIPSLRAWLGVSPYSLKKVPSPRHATSSIMTGESDFFFRAGNRNHSSVPS